MRDFGISREKGKKGKRDALFFPIKNFPMKNFPIKIFSMKNFPIE